MSEDVKADRPYHHGDLRRALLAAALDLVAERGPRGFSLVEVARRAGVSGSAPYRHFAGRDELLAAAGVEAYRRLSAALAEAAAGLVPAQALPRAVAAYVTWSAEDPAGFALLTGGVDPAAHPELQAAADELFTTVVEAARTLLGDRGARSAAALALSAWAVALGHAVLLREGAFDKAAMGVAAVAAAAAAAVAGFLPPPPGPGIGAHPVS